MTNPSFYQTLSPSEAIQLQNDLAQQINLEPLYTPLRLIGGADISFNKNEDTVYAGIVVLKYPEMEVYQEYSATTTIKFPYISGLLAFREIPALLEIWNTIKLKPDVLVLDGHGIAHPRKMGIATHFGIITNTPTIGCAKSKLAGNFNEPENKKFATTELRLKKETVGAVLKTKINCKPVFVSPGNHITLKESVTIIKNSTGKYRIPEPTRLAHLLVNRERLKRKSQS